MRRQRKKKAGKEELLEGCLAAFVRRGTVELRLDELAKDVGTSKRMLVHSSGGRENIEEGAMVLVERRLRARFAPESFPAGVSPRTVVITLWEQTTTPEARGVLLLVMDLSRRAWNGSPRAKDFYAEQQPLWVHLLIKFMPDQRNDDELLQPFHHARLS